MALEATSMASVMLAKALSNGLVDQPPDQALSRLCSTIARGVVTALTTIGQAVPTVVYVGQPAAPTGVGVSTGLTGMSADTFTQTAVAASTFTGPSAGSLFASLSGMIDYLAGALTLTDVLAPIGQGAGTLGGIVLLQPATIDTLHQVAQQDGLMVVVDGTHVTPEQPTLPDPATQEPLQAGDLFSAGRNLITAVVVALAGELAKATATLAVSGPFTPPPVPPVTVPSASAVIS